MEHPIILGLGAVCRDWVSIVDHFPKPDEKVDSLHEEYFPGGVTANYITATQRLGVYSAFIGAVGFDSIGDWLIKDMKNEGQCIDYVIKKHNMVTATNFIIVEKNTGEKMIILSPYFNTTKLSPQDLKEEWFKGAKLLHTTAVHEDLTLSALEYVKKYKLTLTLDLESQIVNRGIKKEILENVDILMPNKLGSMTYTKTKDPIDAAKKFNEMGIELVVVTLGEKGAVGVSFDGIVEVPAFKLDKVVDVTGAGDTFCGAFDVAYCIKKWDLRKSLIFANAAAALKCKKLGARTGMPTMEEVVEFLHNNGYDDF
ncbi:MAG: carbohydrate kinase family protein [Candidatus Helarchaeota archaeon]